MLRTGKIKINGKKKPETYKIEIDDEITFWLTDDELRLLQASEDSKNGGLTQKIQREQKKLQVLYEDEFLVVINSRASMIAIHLSQLWCIGLIETQVVVYLSQKKKQPLRHSLNHCNRKR